MKHVLTLTQYSHKFCWLVEEEFCAGAPCGEEEREADEMRTEGGE